MTTEGLSPMPLPLLEEIKIVVIIRSHGSRVTTRVWHASRSLAKRSNERHSKRGACITAIKSRNETKWVSKKRS